jgi:hypothetical protein
MRTLFFVSLLASATLASPARADDEKPAEGSSSGSLDPSLRGPGSLSDGSPKRRDRMISVFLGLPAVYWGYGGVPFSLGGRYLHPILHDGFVPQLNDSFSLEAGVDLFLLGRRDFGFALSIPVEAMWALHFTPKFAGYLKLGVSLDFRFGDWCWFGRCGAVWPEFIGGLGIMYKLTDALVLRVELGYPGLKLGLGFPL